MISGAPSRKKECTDAWHAVNDDGSGRFVLRRRDETGRFRDVLTVVFGRDGDGLAVKGCVYLPGANPLSFDVVGPLRRPDTRAVSRAPHRS